MEYLDKKALSMMPSTPPISAEPYANVKEIGDALGLSYSIVEKALRRLVKDKLVKIFPSRRRKKRVYGSRLLPEIDINELNTWLIAYGAEPLPHSDTN
jgi:DNA-binding MarR family transcriptional regulator